jgi:hypothetical protein
MIWDTAGQEEFDALTASYYRGAGAAALVFSTVDRASFDAVEKWKKKIEAQCGTGVVMALVQNKVRGGGGGGGGGGSGRGRREGNAAVAARASSAHPLRAPFPHRAG